MIERVAIDTNVLVRWFRDGQAQPVVSADHEVVILLPVLGELYAGAYGSVQRQRNVAAIDAFAANYDVMHPDRDTAILYGRTRAIQRLTDIRASKMNDLWIAALCLQHDLPLLTNDRGFDSIEGLRVISW